MGRWACFGIREDLLKLIPLRIAAVVCFGETWAVATVGELLADCGKGDFRSVRAISVFGYWALVDGSLGTVGGGGGIFAIPPVLHCFARVSSSSVSDPIWCSRSSSSSESKGIGNPRLLLTFLFPSRGSWLGKRKPSFYLWQGPCPLW